MRLNRLRHAFLKENAQTASELAIFGGVLLFVISIIFRAGLNASQNMNHQLRVVRMAMTESYRTAEGQYRINHQESSARNTASLFVLEDRLSVDATSRFGTRDRGPITSGGSATFSMNLFLPTDWGESHNIPIYDVIVNGQRFPFTTAGFKTVTLINPEPRPLGVPESPYPLCSSPPPPGGTCWEPKCFTINKTTCTDPSDPSTCVTNPEDRGCVIMYKIVGNFIKSVDWCGADPCPDNMNVDKRFDLNFDGVPDVPPNPVSLRQEFIWQWAKAAGITKKVQGRYAPPPGEGMVQGIDLDSNVNNLVDVDGDLKEELILKKESNDDGQIITVFVLDNQEGDMNFTLDDRDKGTWKITASSTDVACPSAPVGNCPLKPESVREKVARNFGGTCSVWRCQPQEIGIKNDMQMFSFTKGDPSSAHGGTLMRVEEGKLFDPVDGQYIRHTNRQDHVDIITRPFKVSKDTDRFCDENSKVRYWPGCGQPKPPDDGPCPPGIDPQPALEGVSGMSNPVEACNDCLSSLNIEKTCMDEQQKMIFIRSRVEDLRGRRWVTRKDLPGQ